MGMVNLCENGVCHDILLPAVNDDHGGVIVDMKESIELGIFLTRLRTSISFWRQQEGFHYHHAEQDYLMLVCWINPEMPSTIPANASHRVSVGAIVFNDKREVLVVQEKSGRFRGTGFWKIPTGIVEEGEDISAATVREVKEETGISTKFQEIIAFRQSHKIFFQKSDLFFLCLLHPLSFDIQKQELEIEAAQWMPFEEYAAQPFAQNNELFRFISDLCLAKLEGDYNGFSPLVVPTKCFDDQIGYLYLNVQDWKQPTAAKFK